MPPRQMNFLGCTEMISDEKLRLKPFILYALSLLV